MRMIPPIQTKEIKSVPEITQIFLKSNNIYTIFNNIERLSGNQDFWVTPDKDNVSQIIESLKNTLVSNHIIKLIQEKGFWESSKNNSIASRSVNNLLLDLIIIDPEILKIIPLTKVEVLLLNPTYKYKSDNLHKINPFLDINILSLLIKYHPSIENLISNETRLKILTNKL